MCEGYLGIMLKAELLMLMVQRGKVRCVKLLVLSITCGSKNFRVRYTKLSVIGMVSNELAVSYIKCKRLDAGLVLGV